jgi:succinate dehydrogenase / fumarate reductase iron-sulfur subunit
MDLEGFGGCTLFGECQEACPKGISIDAIMHMNRDYIVASATMVESKVWAGSA